MLNGYGGNILRIDLTTGDISKTPTDPALAEKWLGGRGFGAYFLFTELPKHLLPVHRTAQECRPDGARKPAGHLARAAIGHACSRRGQGGLCLQVAAHGRLRQRQRRRHPDRRNQIRGLRFHHPQGQSREARLHPH